MEETNKHAQRSPFELDPEAAADLTQAILARTSGSPCQRLQALACDFVDGLLDEGQGSLLRGHMDQCTACAALVAALANAGELLPTMAEVDPGPWFTQRVMRATVYAPRRPAFDLPTAWVKLMHRPRIALEAAYLGAAAGLMGAYLPVPLPTLALRIPALVQPLRASAQRVAGQILEAEQRTQASLTRTVLPGITPDRAAPSLTLWQRGTGQVWAWWKGLWKALSPSAKAEEKPSKAANP